MPLTQHSCHPFCLMAEEQHVMMCSAVSYSLHPKLNQNPEGFQYGETWKEAAFCQATNHSAPSLVNCALPLQDQLEVHSAKETHVHTLRSVFCRIFLSLTASIFTRQSDSSPVPSWWNFLQGRVSKKAYTKLSPAFSSEKILVFLPILDIIPSLSFPLTWPVLGSQMKDHFPPASCLWLPTAHSLVIYLHDLLIVQGQLVPSPWSMLGQRTLLQYSCSPWSPCALELMLAFTIRNALNKFFTLSFVCPRKKSTWSADPLGLADFAYTSSPLSPVQTQRIIKSFLWEKSFKIIESHQKPL